MKRKTTVIAVTALLAALTPSIAAAQATVATFSGQDSEHGLSFRVKGAWELHWQVQGNETFPSVSYFEVHLHDALSGRFLGVVAQKTGSGAGIRYLSEGGRFHLDVLGRNVRWKIKVVDAKEPWAAVPGLEEAEEAYRMNLLVRDDSSDTNDDTDDD